MRVFQTTYKDRNHATRTARKWYVELRHAAGRVADFHSLRHTAGTLLAATGAHPKVAQSLMRHSDINLTMSRYSHVLVGQESDAVAALPDLAAPPAEAAARTGTDDALVLPDAPGCHRKPANISTRQPGHADAAGNAAKADPARLALCLALSSGSSGAQRDGTGRKDRAAESTENPCETRATCVESAAIQPGAGVAELADARDSKSRRGKPGGGSTPPFGTKFYPCAGIAPRPLIDALSGTPIIGRKQVRDAAPPHAQTARERKESWSALLR
jgi:hypothetical protein